jgi:PTH1 family peptidyl-tRNA hydrolase
VALRRAREQGRTGAKSSLLIVGLANPGREYEGSRHNVGGDAVRLVAQRRHANLSLERRQRALTATVTSAHGLVTLAIPTTFMNESGAALPPLLRRTSIDDFAQLVVVHDELDLDPGRLQLKLGGGLAGHNGLRSIAGTIDTQEFARLRIGIGKPPSKEQGAEYVLRRPSGRALEERRVELEAAADAIETLLDYDFEEAQRRVNAS